MRISSAEPKRRIESLFSARKIVRISGPAGLRLIKGFHDEGLQGEWEGHRSSRLNAQYRVIYKVEEQRILVLVMDVTAHDYRRQ